jgi:hypothetical protein
LKWAQCVDFREWFKFYQVWWALFSLCLEKSMCPPPEIMPGWHGCVSI